MGMTDEFAGAAVMQFAYLMDLMWLTATANILLLARELDLR